MSKLHVEHCAAESGSASPGGVASKAGATPAALMMPGRICAISSKCSQICGLLSDFVIRSAICCFVLTYSIRTLGFEQTSNNQWTSIRWVRGRCRSAMLLAFLSIFITASLSSSISNLALRVEGGKLGGPNQHSFCPDSQKRSHWHACPLDCGRCSRY